MIPGCKVDLMFKIVILLLQEGAICLFNSMEFAENIERVFKGYRPVKGLHDIYHSPLGPTNPVGKLHVVRYGGTEHDNTNVFGEHDDGFLPDDSSLLVIDVVYLVKDDPFNVPDHFCPSVQVVSKDLGGHYHTRGLLVH